MSTSPSAETLNQITSTILAAGIKVHQALGPGLLESAYLACLAKELVSVGLRVECQKALRLTYGGVTVDCAYRADLVVDSSVLVEVKALDALAPIHSRQLRTYVRLADCRVGLLLNFGAATLKEGIRRIVNNFPDA